MKLFDRLLSVLLVVCMLLAMVPTKAFAEESVPGTLFSDIGSKTFYVGESLEFTINATANSDAEKTVLGSVTFNDPDAVDALEYLDDRDGSWHPIYGDFGPADGFSLTDAVYRFRATFNRGGSFTLTAAMRMADGTGTVCTTQAAVTVSDHKPSQLITDIGSKSFKVGQTTEFSFTTIANDDANTMVVGSAVFSDPDAISKLEYLETGDGNWYELSGNFGPAGGFPMTDATSTFRVTFQKPGNYSVTASMRTADGGTVLCSVTQGLTVADKTKPVLTTDIGSKFFKVGQTTEFSFTTTPNDYAGTLVVGSAVFSDPDAISKLEYLESRDGNWYELSGEFGPAGGFPLMDATSTFRVTFQKPGDYSVTASMRTADGGTVLCSVTQELTVADRTRPVLTSDIGSKTFAVGDTTVFTFTTTPNDYAETLVVGSAVFSDPDAIDKLEYLETRDGNWYELSGDFGPPSGFPLIEGTSTFRVTFKKPGSYTVNASMKTADTAEVLCSTGEIGVTVLPKYWVAVNVNNKDAGSVSIGDGTAVVEGSTLFVTVEAKEGYRIASIEGADQVELLENGMRANVTVEVWADTTINVNFVKTFTVKVNYNENGTVVMGSAQDGGKVITVATGSSVQVTATPEPGYRVSWVEVRSGDEVIKSETFDLHAYAHTEILKVERDYELTVTFAPSTYTVKTEETENGTLTIQGSTEGEDYIVNHGGSATVTVAADTMNHYVIDTLTVNGEPIEVARNTTNMVHEISEIKEDQTVAATFKLREYQVTVVEPSNGTVNVAEWVSHGDNLDIIITPNENYSVGELKINGQRVEELLQSKDGAVLGYEIRKVDGDVTIEVTFVYTKQDYTSITALFNDEDALRVDGRLYVFGSANIPVFQTDRDGIRLHLAGKQDLVAQQKNEQGVCAIALSEEDIRLTGIDLYYQADGESQKNWHPVSGVSDTEPLMLAIDNAAPVFTENYINEANDKGYYTGDIIIGFQAVDPDAYSGIDYAEYVITDNGKPIISKKEQYKYKTNDWIAQITVSEADCQNGTLEVWVVDKAGNKSEVIRYESLKINTQAPRLESVKITSESVNGDEAIAGYFTGMRQFELTVTDRSDTFDKEGMIHAILESVTAKDADGNDLEDPEGNALKPTVTCSSDGNTHILQVTFKQNANYTWSLEKYQNKAGQSIDVKDAQTGDHVWQFTIDTEAPGGKITYKEDSWDKIVETLTFGLWHNDKATVEAEAYDTVSGVKEIRYYLDVNPTESRGLSEDALKNKEFRKDPYTVNTNQKYVVYARLVDKAGNVRYISTNGLGYDNQDGTIEFEMLNEPNENGFYNSDVMMDVKVFDNAVNNVYSGLDKIWYEVYCGDDNTHKESLIEIDGNHTEKWRFHIDSEKNNSNDVRFVVTAWDRAGNVFRENRSFKIDTTKPNISITCNNAENFADYYSNGCAITIAIQERNLAYGDVVVRIIKDRMDITDSVALSWKKTAGTEKNQDDTEHKATIVLEQDGDYEIYVGCRDQAGNEGESRQAKFTIDRTRPEIRVAYDNNDAANGKFFRASRTATVTVTEHNFDAARVNFTRSANRGGINPQVTWAHNGDTHIATLQYTADGDYTFDVTMTDMAGNHSGAADYGTSVAGKEFVIDTVYKDMITLGGVENGKAYGYSAEVIPTVEISDINLEKYTLALIGIQKDNVIDLSEQINALLEENDTRVTGSFDIFEVIQDLDGIYTLKVAAWDQAGNQDAEEITFTVNRFGSVYVYSPYLLALIENGGSYVRNVTEDLIITEYNADKLIEDSVNLEITCDGKPLDTVLYDVTPEINDSVSVGTSGWYQYKYTISKDNFISDGIYKISLSSRDATGNATENTRYANLGIQFWVDSTPAELSSVVGLEDAIINATEQDVRYTVYDTMGIQRIRIYVDDVVIDEITDFSADPNNFSGNFKLYEQSSAQNVRIVIEDVAGNITDTAEGTFTSAYAFEGTVTVSTNLFVRLFANKALLWGSIGGLSVIAAGLWFFLTAKRRKK